MFAPINFGVKPFGLKKLKELFLKRGVAGQLGDGEHRLVPKGHQRAGGAVGRAGPQNEIQLFDVGGHFLRKLDDAEVRKGVGEDLIPQKAVNDAGDRAFDEQRNKLQRTDEGKRGVHHLVHRLPCGFWRAAR